MPVPMWGHQRGPSISASDVTPSSDEAIALLAPWKRYLSTRRRPLDSNWVQIGSSCDCNSIPIRRRRLRRRRRRRGLRFGSCWSPIGVMLYWNSIGILLESGWDSRSAGIQFKWDSNMTPKSTIQ
eukprot:4308766-Pyramimonas_sp.AAC.1